MEENKPSYDQIENELNEYKELLWQLSDEYKVNLGAAEKELAEFKEKFKQLESSKEVPEQEKEAVVSPLISQLGLPACILNNEGEIIEYNNKFKFLIELLSFEIENIENISYLLQRDTSTKLLEKYKNFKNNEEGLFQNIFKIKNAFQGIINILLRIYTLKESTNSLALFIELNKLEIEDLGIEKKNIEVKKPDTVQKSIEIDDEIIGLKTEIAIFAEKYEVYSELEKLFGKKGKKKPEMLPELIHKEFISLFDLTSSRKKILEKINQQYKNFTQTFYNKYPELTSNEEKHCMLIKAGLTYKEIAAIMDISINGVKIARNRLRKKLKLENDIKTSDFISSF